MILKDVECYSGELIHSRFAYRYFRKNTLPIGNIIAFRAPMRVSVAGMIDLEDVLKRDYIESDDAINFCWEIPGLCPLGAVAWQRLFNSLIANLISTKYLNKPITVDGDDLLVIDSFMGNDGETRPQGKLSVSITYSKDNVAIGHTGLNVSAGNNAPPFAYSSNLTDEQCEEFMREVIEMFYSINDDMFIATTKISV